MRCDLWIVILCASCIGKHATKLTFHSRKPHTQTQAHTLPLWPHLRNFKFIFFVLSRFSTLFLSFTLSSLLSFSHVIKTQILFCRLRIFLASVCALRERVRAKILHSIGWVPTTSCFTATWIRWRCLARIECTRNRSTAHARVGCENAERARVYLITASYSFA